MNLRSLFSLFSSDLAIDLGTANTLVFAKGKGHRRQRALDRRHQQEQRRNGSGRQRSQGNARPHARQHRRHQAHERRRDRRLQSHRAHAELLHSEGARTQDAGASANRHRRAERNHAGGKARCHRLRLSRQSERSAPGGTGHGGGHRRGPADHGALGQHGGGHRRRHHGCGRDFAFRYRLLALGARRRQRDGRRHHAVSEAQVQPADRRAHRRSRSRSRSARRIRWTSRSRWRSRGAT